MISTGRKIGKGELEKKKERGRRKSIKKNPGCIVYVNPHPKITVNCMYCKLSKLVKFLKK